MTAFGRMDEMPPDDGWQQLPQQQHMRGGGAEGTGDPGPGGNGGDSRESAIGRGGRSRSKGGSRSRGGIGPAGRAALDAASKAGAPPSRMPGGQSVRGGSFIGTLNEKVQDFMTPDLSDLRNPKMGALSMVPGMGLAVGLGAMFQDIGERLGLEMGPAPDVLATASQGIPEDMVAPGTGAEGTPGQVEAAGDEPAQDADGMTPEERERQRRINRGLSWYQGLMGSWAPGARM